MTSPPPQHLLEAPGLADELARLTARGARAAPLLRLLVAGALGALGAAPADSAGPDPDAKLAAAAAALLEALAARVPLHAGGAAAVAAGVLRAAAREGADAAALQPVLRCAWGLLWLFVLNCVCYISFRTRPCTLCMPRACMLRVQLV